MIVRFEIVKTDHRGDDPFYEKFDSEEDAIKQLEEWDKTDRLGSSTWYIRKTYKVG